MAGDGHGCDGHAVAVHGHGHRKELAGGMGIIGISRSNRDDWAHVVFFAKFDLSTRKNLWLERGGVCSTARASMRDFSVGLDDWVMTGHFSVSDAACAPGGPMASIASSARAARACI